MIIAFYDGIHSLKTDWQSGVRDMNTAMPERFAAFKFLGYFAQKCYEKGIIINCRPEIDIETPNWLSLLANNRNAWTSLPAWPPNKKLGPFIFIISECADSTLLCEMLKWVEEGSNLLILNVWFWDSDIWADRRDPWLSIFERTELEFKEYFDSKAILNHGKGRIFFSYSTDLDDSNLIRQALISSNEEDETSDSELQESNSKVEKFKERIDQTIKDISTFEIPCVDATIREMPLSWLKDERFLVDIEFWNRSAINVERVIVEISIVQGLELESKSTLELPGLKPNELRLESRAARIIPKTKGEIVNPIMIQVSYDAYSRTIHLPTRKISICDNLNDIFKRQYDLASALSKYEDLFEGQLEIQHLLHSILENPDEAGRTVLSRFENIVKSISQKRGILIEEKDMLGKIIGRLQKQKKGELRNAEEEKRSQNEMTAIKDELAQLQYMEVINHLGNQAKHNYTEFSQEKAICICFLYAFLLEDLRKLNPK